MIGFIASFCGHGDEVLSYVKGEDSCNSLAGFKCQGLNNLTVHRLKRLNATENRKKETRRGTKYESQ